MEGEASNIFIQSLGAILVLVQRLRKKGLCSIAALPEISDDDYGHSHSPNRPRVGKSNCDISIPFPFYVTKQ